jgi:hypothetical protein
MLVMQVIIGAMGIVTEVLKVWKRYQEGIQ